MEIRDAEGEQVRLRNVALVSLVIQNAGWVLASKYTFRQGAERYSQAVVVLVAELIKLFLCLSFELRECKWSVPILFKSMSLSRSNAIMTVPSCLYVVQNIAQMHAVNGLPPAVYVTCAQLKVVTSAIFSVCMLNRRLTFGQVLSFFPLMAGVALVQLDNSIARTSTLHFNSMLILLLAVTLSGFSGVLLEMVFKRTGGSIWTKNVFLSVFSVPFACYAVFEDMKPLGVTSDISDVFRGFDLAVWCVILLLSAGGVLTALVMKYAGALTKCYAVSVSIIVCALFSSLFEALGQKLTLNVLLGSTFVICSVFQYQRAD